MQPFATTPVTEVELSQLNSRMIVSEQLQRTVGAEQAKSYTLTSFRQLALQAQEDPLANTNLRLLIQSNVEIRIKLPTEIQFGEAAYRGYTINPDGSVVLDQLEIPVDPGISPEILSIKIAHELRHMQVAHHNKLHNKEDGQRINGAIDYLPVICGSEFGLPDCRDTLKLYDAREQLAISSLRHRESGETLTSKEQDFLIACDKNAQSYRQIEETTPVSPRDLQLYANLGYIAQGRNGEPIVIKPFLIKTQIGYRLVVNAYASSQSYFLVTRAFPKSAGSYPIIPVSFSDLPKEVQATFSRGVPVALNPGIPFPVDNQIPIGVVIKGLTCYTEGDCIGTAQYTPPESQCVIPVADLSSGLQNVRQKYHNDAPRKAAELDARFMEKGVMASILAGDLYDKALADATEMLLPETHQGVTQCVGDTCEKSVTDDAATTHDDSSSRNHFTSSTVETRKLPSKLHNPKMADFPKNTIPEPQYNVSTSDNLLLLQLASHYLKRCFPWNWEHQLSSEEKLCLIEQKKSLRKLWKKFHVRDTKHTTAKNTKFFADEFAFLRTQIPLLRDEIEAILARNTTTSAIMSDISNRLAKFTEIDTRIGGYNAALSEIQGTTVHAKKTHRKPVVSTVIYGWFSHTLTHELIVEETTPKPQPKTKNAV